MPNQSFVPGDDVIYRGEPCKVIRKSGGTAYVVRYRGSGRAVAVEGHNLSPPAVPQDKTMVHVDQPPVLEKKPDPENNPKTALTREARYKGGTRIGPDMVVNGYLGDGKYSVVRTGLEGDTEGVVTEADLDAIVEAGNATVDEGKVVPVGIVYDKECQNPAFAVMDRIKDVPCATCGAPGEVALQPVDGPGAAMTRVTCSNAECENHGALHTVDSWCGKGHDMVDVDDADGLDAIQVGDVVGRVTVVGIRDNGDFDVVHVEDGVKVEVRVPRAKLMEVAIPNPVVSSDDAETNSDGLPDGWPGADGADAEDGQGEGGEDGEED